MEVVTLKSTLLYCLNLFLVTEYKEEEGSFIDFSHNRKPRTSLENIHPQNNGLDWRQIPLQKHRSNTDILYTTALPQILRKRFQAQSNQTQHTLSFQEITLSLTKQLKTFQLKPIADDSLFTEKTLSILSNLWQAFRIESERIGQISFRLSSEGVCIWINQLQGIGQMAEANHTLVIRKGLFKPVENTASIKPVSYLDRYPIQDHHGYGKSQVEQLIWQAQYTYARCCSLIRHWHTAYAQETSPQRDTINSPGPSLKPLTSIALGKQSAQTRQLIQALIATADSMSELPRHLNQQHFPNQQHLQLLRHGKQLHRAFDQFHRAYASVPGMSTTTMGDAVHRSTELQPSTYLILINSTRNLLKVLLNNALKISAPEQL